MIKELITFKNFYFFLILFTIMLINSLLYFLGFSGISGDDFFRALLTYEWTEKPFIASSEFGFTSIIWFPSHFWFGGLFSKLFETFTFSLKFISIIFTMVEFCLFYLFVKNLFDHKTSLISLVLLGFIPFHLWLNISMSVMPLYLSSLAGGVLFLVKWQQNSNPKNFLISSIFFFFCTLFRPEGWIFAFIFIVYALKVLIKDKQYKIVNPLNSILILIIPNIFIIFWLFYNFLEFNDPIYFLHANIEDIQSFSFSSGNHIIAILFQPFIIFIVSPILVFFSIATIIFRFKNFNHIQRTIIYFVLIHFILIVFTSIFGPGTSAAPQRFAMGIILLITPYSAHGILELRNRRFGTIIVSTILIFYIGLNFLKALNFPQHYSDDISVGQYLKEKFEIEKNFAPGKVCSELVFQQLIGIPLNREVDFLRLSSSHAAIAAFSNHPKMFYLNVLDFKINDFLLNNSSKTLYSFSKKGSIEEIFHEIGISRIILSNRNLMKKVPKNYILTAVIGKFSIFTNSKTNYSKTLINKNLLTKFIPLNVYINDNLRIKGYKYSGNILQESIFLVWSIKNKLEDNNYRIYLIFENTDNLSILFKQRIDPIFNWYPNGSANQLMTVIDKIQFLPDGNLESGKYNLYLLASTPHQNTSDNNFNSKQPFPLPLGPVYIISSKRSVLFKAITQFEFNFEILAKTLFLI